MIKRIYKHFSKPTNLAILNGVLIEGDFKSYTKANKGFYK